jgi:hypothetical protein
MIEIERLVQAGIVATDLPGDEAHSVNETRAERYRAEANECRLLAEKAASPIDKEAWLRLANDWLKLADGIVKVPRR